MPVNRPEEVEGPAAAEQAGVPAGAVAEADLVVAQEVAGVSAVRAEAEVQVAPVVQGDLVEVVESVVAEVQEQARVVAVVESVVVAQVAVEVPADPAEVAGKDMGRAVAEVQVAPVEAVEAQGQARAVEVEDLVVGMVVSVADREVVAVRGRAKVALEEELAPAAEVVTVRAEVQVVPADQEDLEAEVQEEAREGRVAPVVWVGEVRSRENG